MKNFGRLTYILDLEVNSAPHGIFLNQYEYIKDLIRLANSSEAFSVDTPLEVNVKYLKDKVDILPKLTLNWRLEEIPIYLTITRPDISFAVHTVTNLWMLLVIFIWWLSATLLDILLGLSSWSILS